MRRIPEIVNRLKNTTEGSWEKDTESSNGLICNYETQPVIYCDLEGNIFCDKNDLDFIIHAKDDVEYLLNIIKVLEKTK